MTLYLKALWSMIRKTQLLHKNLQILRIPHQDSSEWRQQNLIQNKESLESNGYDETISSMQRHMHRSKILGIHGRSTKHHTLGSGILEPNQNQQSQTQCLPPFSHMLHPGDRNEKNMRRKNFQWRHQKGLSQHPNYQYFHHMKNLSLHWKDQQRWKKFLPKTNSRCVDTPTSQIGMLQNWTSSPPSRQSYQG